MWDAPIPILFHDTYIQKSGELLTVLVPRFEAFALPIQSERATKESPTPIRIYIPQKYLYTEKVHRYNKGYKHTPELSTAAMFIGCIMGGCEIPKRQEQSVDKRLFPIYVCPHPVRLC